MAIESHARGKRAWPERRNYRLYIPSAEPVEQGPWTQPKKVSDAGERRLLAFALRYQGRRRVNNVDEIMAEIVAKRLAAHLERAGFVVMQRPAIGGAALARV